jgi:tetratricopeptide (TPR) repeat protein
MTEQAHAAMEKLETLTSDSQILDPLRAAFTSASQPAEEREAQVAEITDEEITPDDIPNFEVAIETQPDSEITERDLAPGYHQEPRNEINEHLHSEAAHFSPELAPTSSEPAAAEAMHADEANELPSFVAELEAALGDSFPIAPPAATLSSGARPAPGLPTMAVPEHATEAETRQLEPEPAGFQAVAHPAAMNEIQPSTAAGAMSSTRTADGAASAAAAMSSTRTADGAASAAAPAMSYVPSPLRPLGDTAHVIHPSTGVDLSEMFGELKQELEEEAIAGDDDPETHYSLGVAFREMGLLDEAIAEFQKVCTAIDRGKAFTQSVQTYTWLAQCFLDKGVPESAIHWYEKALNLPGVNEEGRLAIHYELGSACESAKDRPAALRHFTDVYSANIDYRDVAERIQALKS